MSDDSPQADKKQEMTTEQADRLLFWLEKIEEGLKQLDLEIKVYHEDLQTELDKVKLKNTLQKLVNLKDK